MGYSVNSALTPLTNMGQQLFEPPDVAGWTLGQGWFSTGSTLARMNFAADLATNQRFNLRDAARPFNRSPDEVLGFMIDRVRPADVDAGVYADLSTTRGQAPPGRARTRSCSRRPPGSRT